MDRDPLLTEHHIPSHLLGYNIETAGRTRIIFYCIIPTCLELLAYIIHMTGDFALSYQHFYDKNSLYGGLTLLFVCLPAFIWFLLILLSPAQWPYTIPIQTKSKNIDKMKILFIDNIGNFCQKFTEKEKYKFFGKLLLNLIIFPFAAIQRFSHKIFWSIEALFHDNGTYEHYDSIANACKTSIFELYYFVQPYAQSAPQIILQMYIILRQDIFRNYETTNLQVLSIVFSIINMAFITSTYQRFESQKIVGRHYPWATFNQIQKHKEKFRHSTSVTDMSRQQSLKNNKSRQQRKSDYFPENDKILQRLQLNDDNNKDIEISSLHSESSPIETILPTKKNKNFFNFDNEQHYDFDSRSSQRNHPFYTENYSDDDVDNIDIDGKINNHQHLKINETNNKEEYNKNKNEKLKRTSVGQKTSSSNNEIVSAATTTNATKSHEEYLTLLDKNKENFLASSNCIDPISKDTLNVTDDEKLKNCQKNNNENSSGSSSSNIGSNNNNNNNERNQRKLSQSHEEELNEENVKLIENRNKLYGSVATEALSNNVNKTNGEQNNGNFNDIENLAMSQNVVHHQQQQEQPQQRKHDEEIENINKEKILRNSFQGHNNTIWTLANTIEHIGEEDLNLDELKKYEKYHQNQHQKLRNIKFSEEIDYHYLDEPPESPPPPPPPPTAASRTPSTTASSKNFYNNLNPFDLSFMKTQNSNNKRNSNPFEKLSIYKDMLIYNAENYIVENVPHPPQFICDRVEQSKRTSVEEIRRKSYYSSANPNINDLNMKNDKITMNKYKLEKFPSPNKLHITKEQQITTTLSTPSSSSSSSSSTSFTDIEMKNQENSKSPNTSITKNIPLSEDTVDFFLPSRRKMLHGIEQDDFFGKCTGFFGWFMFIYMRMVSLSVFSVFYQFEFIYLILGHYILMLIFLCIDIDNFKRNLKKFPFYIFLAYVYIFVLIEFKTRFKRIKLWYISYFIIVMIENITMTELWKLCVYSDYNNNDFIEEYELNTYWWFNFLYSTTWGSFLLFTLCLFVYYIILRPNNVILVEKQ